MSSNQKAPPAEEAHRSNQGHAPTCTRHAMTKAIVQHSHENTPYDFKQSYVLGAAENFRLDTEALWAYEYKGWQCHLPDRNSGIHYFISTDVEEIFGKFDNLSYTKTCV